MQIKILGTAAYERVPAMFCQCAVCQQARRLKGKNMRTQAQTLIDDQLLVDFGQDNYIHYLNSGADYTKIKNILITHTHEDHFMPDELRMTTSWFAVNDMTENIGIWGNRASAEKFALITGPKLCDMHTVEAYETFQMGKYTVTALPATHGTESPLIYILSDGKSTLLYNNDTGVWKEELYEFIAEKKFRLDGVLSDCTHCFQEGKGVSHLTLLHNCQLRQRLMEMGVVTEETKWVITHYSHNALHLKDHPVTAEELEQIAAEQGMIAAYDGIVITL